MDEIKLAEKAIQGNEGALLTLLNLYKETMYRIAFSYMRNSDDANDALQDMVYQCLKQFHQVHSPQYFKSWLVKIVINSCLMMKRKQSRIVLTDDFSKYKASESNHNSAENELFELNDMIQQLLIEEQELIHLKYFRDLKNSDIAKLQKIPEGTVKSRLHKAISRLKGLAKEGI